MPQVSKSSKTLEYLFLITIVQLYYQFSLMTLNFQWLSILSSLARTDFNILYAFLCYYLWILKENKITITIILVATVFALLLDFLWLLIVGSIWSETMKNELWSTMSGLHGFVKWMSIFNCILKIGIAIVAFLVRKDYNNSPDEYNAYINKPVDEQRNNLAYKY